MNEWEWQLLEQHVPTESVSVGGVDLKKGDRVVLRPRKGADIFDLALAGQIAIVESLEQDYEGKLHLAVVIEEDPGRDLGVLRQPGHRFFFSPEEVQPCEPATGELSQAVVQPRILVACIGNIFLGDDGFGMEVAQKLSVRQFPATVLIRDFGIRSYDLVYALLDGYDLTILVDACPRHKAPGTVYLIEPDLEEAGEASAPVTIDAHTMNPVSVLRMAKSMGPISKRLLLVGCEPATLGGEEGHIGLSDAVSGAVDRAVQTIEKLIADALRDEIGSHAAYGS